MNRTEGLPDWFFKFDHKIYSKISVFFYHNHSNLSSFQKNSVKKNSLLKNESCMHIDLCLGRPGHEFLDSGLNLFPFRVLFP